MKIYKKALFALIVTFFIVSTNSVLAQELLSIQGYPYQGGMLFLKVKNTSPDQFGICFWDRQVFPLARKDNNLEVILPTSVEIKPGRYKVSVILYSIESGNLVLTRDVEIKPTKFYVQYLRLSQAQLDKYSHPEIDEEYHLIDRALLFYSGERYWKGNFIWPCKGYISTQFGLKRYVNGKPFGWHRGVDIACPWGTSIKAPNDGKVILVNAAFMLHGQTVIVDHGQGLTTLYIHLSKICVKEGDLVKKGQVIGKVGSTGVSTGPHLHWATYAFGTPVNPKCLFKMIE